MGNDSSGFGRNLGPKSKQMLERAGIHTSEQLRELGAVRAYVQVKRCGGNASLNLLWALQGALTDRHWQEVVKQDRLPLLLELEDAEREYDHSSGGTEAS